jgi:TonB family protein
MWVHPGTTMLSAYYDEKLSLRSMAIVDEHLNVCESCRLEYRVLAHTANSVRHLSHLDASASLAPSVRERIDAEERGMVLVLRGQIIRTGNHSGFFSAVSLGTITTILLLGLAVLFDHAYGEHATRKLFSALIPTALPEPVLLHELMSSPRLRGGSAFDDAGRGKEGTVLTMASIDQNGRVRALDVIYRSSDEEMLTRTLEAVRAAGFEPSRLRDQTISVNFLYMFTTTEVRPTPARLSTLPVRRRWKIDRVVV